MDSNLFQPTCRPPTGPTTLCECVCSEEGGGCELFLHSPEVCAGESAGWPSCSFGSAAPYWSASCVFNCTSVCHLAFLSDLPVVSPNTSYLLPLSISSSVSHPPLRPPPPNLAFCMSASLLFHSLPINLVCLGGRRGVGEKGHGQRWTVKEKRGAALGTRWVEEGNERGTTQL